MNPIDQAIQQAGGVSRLASILGVTPQAVSNWRSRESVPAEQVLAIETATGISRHDLRPDVFGVAPDAAA